MTFDYDSDIELRKLVGSVTDIRLVGGIMIIVHFEDEIVNKIETLVDVKHIDFKLKGILKIAKPFQRKIKKMIESKTTHKSKNIGKILGEILASYLKDSPIMYHDD